MAESCPDVVLYVKAGCDGKRYGACPFCQRVFMVLLLKSNKQPFKFKVVSVNLSKPPEEFKERGLKRVPAILHGDECYDTVDDILTYLDNRFPQENLSYNNTQAENVCKNFFSKFCYYIKEVTKDATQLENELKRLSDYMNQKDHTFLCGERLTHLDCEVLPKLQHLRVSLQCLKKYNIPPELTGFWRYMYNAYQNETFTRTCPSNQEIILHWSDKPETPNLPFNELTQIIREKEQYAWDVPAIATSINIS